jgi:SAM-dependent methyltransferase
MNCRRTYNLNMAQSLGSKLFFIEHVPMRNINLVLDYGCGDAALLKAVRHLVPTSCLLCGADNDPLQRAAARANFVDIDGLTSGWSDYRAYRQSGIAERSLLILSSVLHEVASHQNLEAFWREVEGAAPEYIAIRDMSVPKSYSRLETPASFLHALPDEELDHINEHASKWGDLGSLSSFIHYLLKRPYKHDWRRELSENYLARPAEDLVSLLTSGPYSIVHARPTVTPYFIRKNREELGIDLTGITTHMEIVLKHHDTLPEASVRRAVDA